MKTPSDHFQPPWRTAGIQRSWGGKSELAWLLSRLGAANESSFEKLALILLRLALSPPDRMLDSEA
ncbi:MAG TPA: hypothetical protein VHK68_12445, partial [Gemmatimonadales bacterium]|nr:hypothetical protein [Gemmatimonadales bacterium]